MALEPGIRAQLERGAVAVKRMLGTLVAGLLTIALVGVGQPTAHAKLYKERCGITKGKYGGTAVVYVKAPRTSCSTGFQVAKKYRKTGMTWIDVGSDDWLCSTYHNRRGIRETKCSGAGKSSIWIQWFDNQPYP